MMTQAEIILSQTGIRYNRYTYPEDEGLSAAQIAGITGIEPELVYKTLVCRGAGHHTYVFVVPCKENLDFEKAAAVVGEKRLSLAPRNALKAITGGYMKGSCTPIGMKAGYPVILDKGMGDKEKICLNGGRLGVLIQLSPKDLMKVTGAVYKDIVAGR